MDGREGMTLPGSGAYYLSRGGIGGTSGSGPAPNIHGSGMGSSSAQAGRIHHPTPAFKNPSNHNNPFQTNVGLSGCPASGSSVHIENPPANFSHGLTTAIVPSGVSQGSEPVKKKRGRPRKYGLGGASMALALSPLSTSKPSSGVVSPGEKGRRGRPPGTGWKQKLAPLGEWMNSSAGLAFTPHVLRVGAGEDIAVKILAFAQQRPRALCVMSANGSVSGVTLRQPTNSGGTVTYEGRFEILSLSGSYLVAESGGPHNRTGGISISVCSHDGLIIGGAIGGKLIAVSPVQVVACSFVYGNTKVKSKADSVIKDEKYLLEHSTEKSLTPVTPPASTLSFTPNSEPSIWPPVSRPEVKSSRKDIDLVKSSQKDIDLTHG